MKTDKTLSRREFVDVMKARLQRGLDRQRGIEFTAKLWALGSCACETYAPESVKNVYNLVAEKLESQSKTEDKKVEEWFLFWGQKFTLFVYLLLYIIVYSLLFTTVFQ